MTTTNFNDFAVWYGCDEDWTDSEIVDFFMDECGIDVSEFVGKRVIIAECDGGNGLISHHINYKISIESEESFKFHTLYN